jgi:hypothetical protein
MAEKASLISQLAAAEAIADGRAEVTQADLVAAAKIFLTGRKLLHTEAMAVDSPEGWWARDWLD